MSIWVSEGSGTVFAPIVISRRDRRRRCLHDPDPMVDRVGVIVNNPLTKRRVLQKPFPLCACKVMLFLRRQPPLKLGPHFRRLPRMFGKRIKASFGYPFLARCDLFVDAMCVGRHRWNGARRIATRHHPEVASQLLLENVAAGIDARGRKPLTLL